MNGVSGKLSLMIFGSFALFMFFSFLDEYENLLAPFLKKEKNVLMDARSTGEVENTIKRFNAMLSQIYLSSNPLMIRTLPADETVKKAVADDIDFLIKSGKVMNILVGDIVVEGVEAFPPVTLRVKTGERVSLSYLNLSDRGVAIPAQDAIYQMVYTLEKRGDGWIIVGHETVGIEGVKKGNG